MLNLEARKQMKIVSGFLLVAASIAASGMWSSAAAADLGQLSQSAKVQAAQLRRDTVDMESFTRSNLEWRSHTAQVEKIKSDVNKVGATVSQLQAARGDAGKRDQDTIDRVVGLLQELASNTTAIIDHLNQTPGHLKNPTYEGYLKANVGLATAISQEVSDAVAYDSAAKTLEKLQDQVGKLG